MRDKQGNHIGVRYIELYSITYGEFLNFSESQLIKKSVRLATFITETNYKRTIKLRGLPFQCNARELVELFKEYNISESDCVLEQERGKNTGYALIFFKTEQIAEDAIKNMQKRTIGNRYIEIMPVTLKI